MRVHILALDLHVGAVAQPPLDHRCDLGRGTPLQLRIDARGLALDMPIDHHAATAIACMPFGHEVSVPGAELGRIEGASCARLTPDQGITDGERGIGDPLQADIGSCCIKRKQETPVTQSPR